MHVISIYSNHNNNNNSKPAQSTLAMAHKTYHSQVMWTYLTHMVLRDILLPPDDDIEQPSENLQFDLTVLEAIRATRYLRGRPEVAKCGNLHLAWEYAQDPHNHKHFINMLRVSPHVFDFTLTLIKDHPVFFNNSHVPQTPVNVQLAVTLYRMGRFGNGASLEDIARTEGSVEEFTDCCFEAMESQASEPWQPYL